MYSDTSHKEGLSQHKDPQLIYVKNNNTHTQMQITKSVLRKRIVTRIKH